MFPIISHAHKIETPKMNCKKNHHHLNVKVGYGWSWDDHESLQVECTDCKKVIFSDRRHCCVAEPDELDSNFNCSKCDFKYEFWSNLSRDGGKDYFSYGNTFYESLPVCHCCRKCLNCQFPWQPRLFDMLLGLSSSIDLPAYVMLDIFDFILKSDGIDVHHNEKIEKIIQFKKSERKIKENKENENAK